MSGTENSTVVVNFLTIILYPNFKIIVLITTLICHKQNIIKGRKIEVAIFQNKSRS